jgi:hypothetical protein
MRVFYFVRRSDMPLLSILLLKTILKDNHLLEKKARILELLYFALEKKKLVIKEQH